jgi:hypothetical protein
MFPSLVDVTPFIKEQETGRAWDAFLGVQGFPWVSRRRGENRRGEERTGFS